MIITSVDYVRTRSGLQKLVESASLKRHGRRLLLAFGALYTAVFVLMAVVGMAGYDSHAYWSAWHHGLYLNAQAGGKAAYLYSPAFAQILKPLTWLPWPVFRLAWLALITAIYAWLLAPVSVRWRLLWWMLVFPDIFYGNVFSILALVLVLGARYPFLWAFPLLTKILPAVGLAWFALRREWRKFGIALGVTAVIVVVSVAISPLFGGPHLWRDWVRMLIAQKGYATRTSNPVLGIDIPLFVRGPVAGSLIWLAVRKNRYLLLAPAMVVATPVFGPVCLAILAALPRLRMAERSHRASAGLETFGNSDSERIRAPLPAGASGSTT